MKKNISILITLLLVTVILNNARISLESAGNNVYSSYLTTCDLNTVKQEVNTLFGFPTEVRVEEWNCDGVNKSGSSYTAQIWDHFFWLL